MQVFFGRVGDHVLSDPRSHGGFEAGLGVSTDLDLDLEARLVEAD